MYITPNECIIYTMNQKKNATNRCIIFLEFDNLSKGMREYPMKNNALKIVVCLFILAITFVSGFAIAQEKTTMSKEERGALTFGKMILSRQKLKIAVLKQVTKTELTKEDLTIQHDLASLYLETAGSTTAEKLFLANVLRDHMEEKVNAETALQVSNANENALVEIALLQAAQNQRIIELLEKMQPSPKKP